MSSFKDAALEMLSRGFYPIPLCWPKGAVCGCGRGHSGNDIGKAPLVGKGYENLRPDYQMIEQWAVHWPDANVGILLDPSKLIFVGPDSPDGSLEARRNGLPPTTFRYSANAAYLYRRSQDCTRATRLKIGTSHGIDVKSNGYAVAFGKHRLGDEIFLSADEPTAAPEWIIKILNSPRASKTNNLPQGVLTPEEMQAECKLADVALRLLSPNRHEDYDDWITIGMALSELDDPGFDLWDRWSRLSPKYEEQECLHKWKSFDSTEDDRVRLGTLFYLAEEDSHINVARSLVTTNKKHSFNHHQTPLPIYENESPIFPVSVLPGWLRRYVEAESIATQTPPDLTAFLILGVLSMAAAKKFVVQLRQGWIEPTNLYCLGALPSGNRKSAAYQDTVAPVEEFERTETERLGPEVAEAASKRKIDEKRLEGLQAAAAKNNSESKRAEEAALELARDLATREIPTLPRFIADDITPEKLPSVMAANDGRLAVMSAEGDFFDVLAGRYSEKGANIGTVLKAHSGDTIRVDRVGRPAEFIQQPALTIALVVQPDVLRGLAQQPTFRGRGLLARILYSWPNSWVGSRDTKAPPLPDEVREEYRHGVLRLLRLPYADANASHFLQLDDAAAKAFETFEAQLEPRLDIYGDLGNITDWGSKLAGAVARIAGLFHLAIQVNSATPWQEPISRDCVVAAINLADYLIAHALRSFAEMGTDPTAEDARYLLGLIERMDLKEFSRRDLFRPAQRRFKRVELMQPALDLLVEHAYLFEGESDDKSGAGRKASPTYIVNQEGVSKQTNKNSVNFVNSVNGGSHPVNVVNADYNPDYRYYLSITQNKQENGSASEAIEMLPPAPQLEGATPVDRIDKVDRILAPLPADVDRIDKIGPRIYCYHCAAKLTISRREIGYCQQCETRSAG